MTSKLKEYFPIIRERKEILAEIRKSRSLQRNFKSWTKSQQEEFLDICTGAKGLKLLYDGFFKEVMNPEYVPERLSDFLSCLLGQKIKVIKTIPTDSGRIADESSLLAMDIVVELSDGSIANVEMQRIGYLFPGQRSACYSADLLLRQYKRIRGSKGNFNYRDIKNVYTIVLFEKSPRIFHAYPEIYYHFFEQKSDTGLKVELLQKYLFIPLDIFTKNRQNRNINNKRDAWLTLFSSDMPEKIAELLENYPEFKDIYEEGYQICLNMEKVMGLFSKELYMLDRNTEKYMFEEMQLEMEEERKKMQFDIEEMRKKMQFDIEEMRKKMQFDMEKMQFDMEKMQLEKNEAQFQIAEIQEKSQLQIAQMQSRQEELENKYNQSLRNTVSILRSAGFSDDDIVNRLCAQYQFEEMQARQYL